MPSGNMTLFIEQGSTYIRKLTFQDPQGNELDLTGQTFQGMIRKNIGDPNPVATFSFEVLDQTTNRGEVLISLSAATSSAIVLKPQKGALKIYEDFAYDIERTLINGNKERVLEGVVKISPEVTR
jgi:hypothetical protein